VKYAGLVKGLKQAQQSGDEILSLCPFHQDSSPSFHFNVRKGLFICFACGEKGSAKKLARQLDMALVENSTVQGLLDAMSTLEAASHVQWNPPIDERILGRYRGPVHPYWVESRGFSRDTCLAFHLGYDPIRDNLTIPYRNIYGDLLGVIRRRLDEGIYPKYLYPKGVRKNMILFGIEKVAKQKIDTVALVEGSLDAVWCWQNGIPAVAQLGSSLSEEQVELLHEAGVRTVILLHDYDLAGRKGAFQAFRLLAGFIRVTPLWSETEYCWHEWLCGCGKHVPMKASACPQRRRCKCDKKHGADPGGLDPKALLNLIPDEFAVDDAVGFVKNMRLSETEKLVRKSHLR
jgi:hypothetical protein